MTDKTAAEIQAEIAEERQRQLDQAQQDRLKLTVSLLTEDGASKEKQERIIKGNI